jgi:two-component system, NarL family, nitrate/nitrite response regulator NarL
VRRDGRPRVRLVIETGFFREALARALPRRRLVVVEREDDPDVILVDVTAGGGLGMVRKLAVGAPATPLLAVGVRDVNRDVLACIEAGATGYVLRDATLDELADATHRAVRDESTASPHVIAALMRRVAALSANGRHGGVRGLTARELEIVELIEKGLSNKEIAAELTIAVTTVKNHVHSILEKLNLHRRGEVASFARNGGLSA